MAAAAAEVGLRLPTGLEATDSRSLGEALQSAARGHAVLGLEVVLPDGRVWQDATEVLGSATHRALGHLFFAAGGALGVVTAVALRLQAAQAGRGDDHDDVPELAWAPDCAGPRLEAQALDAELLARIKRAFDPNHLLNPGQRL
jgi:FAD/FMN-containing dehydrogenase